MAVPLHDEPSPGRQTGRSRGDELDLPALYLRGMSPRLLTREEELQLATTLVQARRELALVVCSTPPGVERLQWTARQLQRRELRLADVFDGADTVPAARLLAVIARLVRLQRRHAAVDLGLGRARTALQRRWQPTASCATAIASSSATSRPRRHHRRGGAGVVYP